MCRVGNAATDKGNEYEYMQRKGGPTQVLRVVSMMAVMMIVAVSCTQTNPLSVTLMDPKTKTTMKCSAREGAGADTAALSRTVETCARQLEAHGFVRVND